MKDKFIGIDLGGTFIKGGIVTKTGDMLFSDSVDTQAELGPKKIVENICFLVKKLLEKSNLSKDNFVGIGVGVPGIIDSTNGIAVCSHNLHFDNFEIKNKIEKEINLTVKIANDANLALLGETLFGAAKGCKNVVMLTLGTGVGGGAIVDGLLLEGNKSAGAEFGHFVVEYNGNKCSCGRKGCLEAYSSAKALIKKTKEEMQKNKNSKMWKIGDIEKVNGKTAFDYSSTDKTAQEVVDWYLNYLACGITNYSNIFRPEVFIIGGGVSNQGEALINPLQKIVDSQIFASDVTPKVKIVKAKLGNNAGVLGSVGLFKN